MIKLLWKNAHFGDKQNPTQQMHITHLVFRNYVTPFTTKIDIPHLLSLFFTYLDLSAMVGCWSSVSMRRIIYKFLNVCPFDYTAVAVSGKVERS